MGLLPPSGRARRPAAPPRFYRILAKYLFDYQRIFHIEFGAILAACRMAARRFGERPPGGGRPPPANGQGRQDDETTRRRDRPRPPSERGGRFLVVPSACRLVVLAQPRGPFLTRSPRRRGVRGGAAGGRRSPDRRLRRRRTGVRLPPAARPAGAPYRSAPLLLPIGRNGTTASLRQGAAARRAPTEFSRNISLNISVYLT